MDWHHIRQEAYAAVLNIDRYELVPPPHYTPAVVYFESNGIILLVILTLA